MILDDKGNVRLTKSELNKLRQENAKNGEVLGSIKTDQDLLAAALSGLPNDILNDMLEFFETGSSPLTSEGRTERSETRSSEPNKSE
jgi:hypothetical protein